ncbi:hypothetical protein H312_03116 [Anncaliia algerae PRA339]|uniref:Uncharacterized protein n=1 Tax=Anncaliia algerae PRA339 TaxID=1288291 RepID=A0A059EXA5_9MICR|nr:hypothetical protein H312_03116 [Anncaliia algerae PRA339]
MARIKIRKSIKSLTLHDLQSLIAKVFDIDAYLLPNPDSIFTLNTENIKVMTFVFLNTKFNKKSILINEFMSLENFKKFLTRINNKRAETSNYLSFYKLKPFININISKSVDDKKIHNDNFWDILVFLVKRINKYYHSIILDKRGNILYDDKLSSLVYNFIHNDTVLVVENYKKLISIVKLPNKFYIDIKDIYKNNFTRIMKDFGGANTFYGQAKTILLMLKVKVKEYEEYLHSPCINVKINRNNKFILKHGINIIEMNDKEYFFKEKILKYKIKDNLVFFFYEENGRIWMFL